MQQRTHIFVGRREELPVLGSLPDDPLREAAFLQRFIVQQDAKVLTEDHTRGHKVTGLKIPRVEIAGVVAVVEIFAIRAAKRKVQMPADPAV